VAEATSHATLLQVSAQCDTGVDLHGYRGRHSLGQDRIASAAGALARHGPGPLIVVDFGTAATFNVLDASGRFLGGVIAPGLAAVRDYLPERTAQLPPLNLRRRLSAATGGDTRASMLAGVTLGYRGLVREIVTGIRAELESPARVIATGGDARWVAGQLPGTFDVIDPDLTLHGLRTIATRHRWP
jgi:type III pantothenate kinase